MKLELGKCYVRRDGEITSPLIYFDKYSPYFDPLHGYTYTEKGFYFHDEKPSKYDLVLEVKSYIPYEQQKGNEADVAYANGKLDGEWEGCEAIAARCVDFGEWLIENYLQHALRSDKIYNAKELYLEYCKRNGLYSFIS